MGRILTFRTNVAHIIRIKLSTLPSFVKIVEVGPRDGLQNEKITVPTPIKIEFIDKLSETGLKNIEVTSFVSPEWIPQLADNIAILGGIKRCEGVKYSALVPNMTGFKKALEAHVDEIAVFGAASETFSQKNINCGIEKSLERFKPVILAAKHANLRVRGYVSCAIACPYEGKIGAGAVADLTLRLKDLGCDEISLGDTVGIGTPADWERVVSACSAKVPISTLAVHCHNTYGQALANILTVLKMGISVVDASAGGIGGCPYAKGATGNVPTEDVIYMLDGLGIRTGINLDKLIEAGNFMCDALNITTRSQVALARSHKTLP